ncbi:hypothetical protein HKX48_005716 [Thoreauomyces humboldtii]|nr:hypothetical protein HKX48_005716 [Thoreauomyces humboldtii]
MDHSEATYEVLKGEDMDHIDAASVVYDSDRDEENRDARGLRERAERDERRAAGPHRHGRDAPRDRSPRPTPYHRPRGEGTLGAAKFTGPPRPAGYISRKECRVYVGNLSYEVGWKDLKLFMSDVGEVIFSDVLMVPGGRSKGCGIVEYASPEQATRAIKELCEKELMGRPVFIREDRETEVKTEGTAHLNDHTLSICNLPYVVTWQALKDFCNRAGPVVRADVSEGWDRRSLGVGTVVFKTAADANNAIAMLDGAMWPSRGHDRGYDRYHRGYERPPPHPHPRDYYGGYRGGYGGPPPRDYYPRDYGGNGYSGGYGEVGYGGGYGGGWGFGGTGGGYAPSAYDRGEYDRPLAYPGEYGQLGGMTGHRNDYDDDARGGFLGDARFGNGFVERYEGAYGNAGGDHYR